MSHNAQTNKAPILIREPKRNKGQVVCGIRGHGFCATDLDLGFQLCHKERTKLDWVPEVLACKAGLVAKLLFNPEQLVILG